MSDEKKPQPLTGKLRFVDKDGNVTEAPVNAQFTPSEEDIKRFREKYPMPEKISVTFSNKLTPEAKRMFWPQLLTLAERWYLAAKDRLGL